MSKYSLFPTHPSSSPPSEPLPPLPEGQVPSSLATAAFPRPPSRGSPIKPHATLPAVPAQGLPPQPHPTYSSHQSQGLPSPQSHASFPSSPTHRPTSDQAPFGLSTEQGPSPHHFDPAFPPPLPHATKPSFAQAAPHQQSVHQEARKSFTQPAELEGTNPFPPFDNTWPPHGDSTSTLKGPPTAVASASSPTKRMHTPTMSCSTTTSSSSLHKPINNFTQTSQPRSNAQNARPRTVYFHSGLGGAGNYHKVIREDNVLKPMNGNRSNQPRFLTNLLGTLGGKKSKRKGQNYDGTGSGGSSDGSSSGQSSSQTLPLGAAEVMRRKMLRIDRK